jgi:hypothetical protein
VISTAGTALVVEVCRAWLPTRLAIVGVTSLVDGAISLAVFASVHLYANRSRGATDLVRVQVHRWILSPLHYVIGATLQLALLGAGLGPGVSVLLAYLTAVGIVRTVHTMYGKRTGLFH